MDKAGIVIVHYKNEADTLECLNSILINHAQNQKFHIILVINPSLEQKNGKSQVSFTAKLKNIYPDIVIIENEINTGFAAGNNTGIKKALDLGCEDIILLNNDTLVSLGLLDKLLDFARSQKNLGMVSPKIYFAPGFEYHKDRYRTSKRGRVIWYAGGKMDWDNILASHRGVDEVDRGQYEKAVETDFATGCCMLIRKKAIEKSGLFDERYFLYYEDIDLSVRVKKDGFKVMYYPKAFLWHKNASSSGKPGSRLHLYYQNRNRLYFGFKYGSLRVKKSLIIDSLKMAGRGGVHTKSVIDYFLGKMGGTTL